MYIIIDIHSVAGTSGQSVTLDGFSVIYCLLVYLVGEPYTQLHRFCSCA